MLTTTATQIKLAIECGIIIATIIIKFVHCHMVITSDFSKIKNAKNIRAK